MKYLNGKVSLLSCLIAMVAASTHTQPPEVHSMTATASRTCENLRREMSLLFEQVYEKVPALLNMMMSVAQDPTTGKRIEFGADVMKNMIVNTFTSFLAPCASPAVAREQVDPAKPPTLSGHFSKLHRSMNPQARYHVKGNSHKRVVDSVQEKPRQKRSSSGHDAKIGSDYLTIGDAAIPLELFQAHDKGGEDEEKNQITLEITV